MSGDSNRLHLGRTLPSEPEESGELGIERESLTTHGVIVGMTGSGKTGLGVVLLEEVLGSGVPALILDPKGDMGNLLLNFPELRGGDFEPWIDPSEARREGLQPEELAERTAEKWKHGLAGSGIDGSRMQALLDTADFRLFTPGSSAGTPLNLVGDLSAPDADWDTDSETLRDEIEGLVSGLLVMAGIESDPLTSRDHILLSNLVETAWREGRHLDLPSLIGQIQQPPFRRLGVFELDTFFPANDRLKLAMRLNGLIASPSFAEWMTGEPADIETLLRAPDGRPRASIVYLSHLTESERQFVVTLLLTRLVTWMRKQPGTSDLRALVYADEVMGFAPPTAEPPTKRPLLTLFKQARAHGLGLIMATQNPVDLDYKLMSNAGTWMIGRLQTERDKARILEGLKSASGDVDVGAWDARIGGLGKREFLLKTAGSAAPVPFTTRWAMSYLRGPLTRAELVRLTRDGADAIQERETSTAPSEPGSTTRSAGDRLPGDSRTVPAGPASATPPASDLDPDETPVAPVVADTVPVRYLRPDAPWRDAIGSGTGSRRLEPGLAARIRMVFDERVGNIRHEEEWEAIHFPLRAPFDPADPIRVDYDDRDFTPDPPDGATWMVGRAPLDTARFFRDAERDILDALHHGETLDLFRSESLGLVSRPDESRDAFEARCLEEAEKLADEEAARIRQKYEARLETASRRQAEAARRVRELEADVDVRRQNELIQGAGQVLSMFLGGRSRTRSLSGISSRRSQTQRVQERLLSAGEKADDLDAAILDIEADLSRELEQIWETHRRSAQDITPFAVPLERNDLRVESIVLFWAPQGRNR